MKYRRAVSWVAVVALLAGLTSSCTVPDDGWMAVGRASDGSLRVFLRTCTYPLDGATLYWPDDPANNRAEEEVFAEWTIAAAAAGGPVSIDWPLLGVSDNATVVPLRPLAAVPEPPKNLALYGWTRDDSTSADGPFQFLVADLDRLRPGQLLIANDTGNADEPPNKVISRQAFAGLDCA